MDFFHFLASAATSHDVLVYGFILAVAIVEGPIVSLACGFLIKAGTLPFLPAYLVLMAGDLIGDAGWYWVGSRWGAPFIARFGRYFSLTDERVERIKGLYRRHQEKILVISKLTTGLGMAGAVLFTAGLSGVPFKRYMLLNVLGQLVWTGSLVALGFSLGHLYVLAGAKIDALSIGAACAVALLCLIGLGRYAAPRLVRKLS